MAFETDAGVEGKLIEAQRKLAEFQKEHNILGVDENDNIITDKLKQLNQQLTDAEADRIRRKPVIVWRRPAIRN